MDPIFYLLPLSLLIVIALCYALYSWRYQSALRRYLALDEDVRKDMVIYMGFFPSLGLRPPERAMWRYRQHLAMIANGGRLEYAVPLLYPNIDMDSDLDDYPG